MKQGRRLFMYCKDVMMITGKGEKASRNLIRRIKKAFDKKEHQDITVVEFSVYTGADLEDLWPYIR
ncbi:hypothetical protein [Echinicola shivajiensis]|uniref:hypothetical protein n=1 Tax=Echinicola shivajiensis TaxID=1035916 RepID=UPI001BFCC992|nr:hypothetical protein [Echinicola shivajiensis]